MLNSMSAFSQERTLEVNQSVGAGQYMMDIAFDVQPNRSVTVWSFAHREACQLYVVIGKDLSGRV